ncbi:hypothetical protein U2A4042370184 [Corynebacterium striatum]|nr:hypothetical protein U2A4042370184 [Corynebacterium striatum]
MVYPRPTAIDVAFGRTAVASAESSFSGSSPSSR